MILHMSLVTLRNIYIFKSILIFLGRPGFIHMPHDNVDFPALCVYKSRDVHLTELKKSAHLIFH